MVKALCENCKWWLAGGEQPRLGHAFNEGGGECRHRSPHGGTFYVQMKPDKDQPPMISGIMYPFPPTHAKDWCGDHQFSETSSVRE